MSISRRKFVQIGSVAGLAAAIPGPLVSLTKGQTLGRAGTANITRSGPQMDVVASLTFASFSEVLHSQFEVVDSFRATLFLELAEVTKLKQTPVARIGKTVRNAAPAREGFSAVFTGPLNMPLGQQTYKFTHPKLGVFDLLMVPIGLNTNVRFYEIIINRLH